MRFMHNACQLMSCISACHAEMHGLHALCMPVELMHFGMNEIFMQNFITCLRNKEPCMASCRSAWRALCQQSTARAPRIRIRFFAPSRLSLVGKAL
ncbi:MAG: hypothetical protein P4M14_05570, partial [Gammaproteobacteria bacterium]|nr:hypothetical protein [Gammaproteobacteria bacterium]